MNILLPIFLRKDVCASIREKVEECFFFLNCCMHSYIKSTHNENQQIRFATGANQLKILHETSNVSEPIEYWLRPIINDRTFVSMCLARKQRQPPTLSSHLIYCCNTLKWNKSR